MSGFAYIYIFITGVVRKGGFGDIHKKKLVVESLRCWFSEANITRGKFLFITSKKKRGTASCTEIKKNIYKRVVGWESWVVLFLFIVWIQSWLFSFRRRNKWLCFSYTFEKNLSKIHLFFYKEKKIRRKSKKGTKKEKKKGRRERNKKKCIIRVY